MADLDDEEEKDTKYRCLEGNPPKAFDSDRAQTIWFLTQFKQFMLMNWKANIAKDPIAKCCYFLALFKGSKVEGWCEQQYAWLDKVEANPWILSHGMTAWDALEQDFRHLFIDYAIHEKAHNNLRKLKMSGGNVNQYIADFKFLAQRTGINVNDPTAIRLFSEGMPFSLAESCIKLKQPKSFKQWAKAAQAQQRNYILIQGLKRSKDGSSTTRTPPTQTGNATCNPFFWRWGGGQQQSQRPQNSGQSPVQQLPPCDPNAMDTSAAAQKAITEADKERYRKEGRCFKCDKQGHIARNCPSKKACACTAKTLDVSETASVVSETFTKETTTASIASWISKLTDEERDELIAAMQGFKEGEEGFQDTWAT